MYQPRRMPKTFPAIYVASNSKLSQICLNTRRHTMKHSDVKDLSCKVCEFKCKRKSDMSRHQKLTHENLPFLECYLCSYKTKNRAHMKRHSKVHQQSTSFEIYVDENDVMI